jgi:transposase
MRQRRRFSGEFKARVTLEILTGQRTMAEICRAEQLLPEVVSRWKSEFLARAATVFEGDAAHQQAQQRMAELERLIGQLTLELEIAKKASRLLARSTNA